MARRNSLLQAEKSGRTGRYWLVGTRVTSGPPSSAVLGHRRISSVLFVPGASTTYMNTLCAVGVKISLSSPPRFAGTLVAALYMLAFIPFASPLAFYRTFHIGRTSPPRPRIFRRHPPSSSGLTRYPGADPLSTDPPSYRLWTTIVDAARASGQRV